MNQSLEEVFRSNLKFYRQKARISQEKLSTKLDKNINYINMIESGKSLPPINMIEQIANELDVEPYRLLEKTEAERGVFDKNDFIEEAAAEIANTTKTILNSLFRKLY